MTAARPPTVDRGRWVAWALVLGLWALVSVPLVTGFQTLFFRDVLTTHLPFKAVGATELATGRIPAVDPGWGLGQPYRGNPNTLAFYPGNLLYLALPFWIAFNLHYVGHWLLAALAMVALARKLGVSPPGALVAGVTYAGSGWVLTTLSFYNLLVVSAWWPVAMWGAVSGGRRGVAVGGAACGLALLGGDPGLALLGLPALLFAASVGNGSSAGGRVRRGVIRLVVIGAIGLVVALPQVVATGRVLGFAVRGTLGADSGPAAVYGMPGVRLAELFVPLPFGWPESFGELGFAAVGVLPGPPYLLSLHWGAVGLALAVLGARRWRGWAVLAAAGVLFAFGASVGGDLLALGSGGLLRYPAKLCFLSALAVPLLAGRGLDELMSGSGRQARWLLVWGGLTVGAGILALLVPGSWWTESSLGAVAIRWRLWGHPLLIGGAALMAAAVAGARRWRWEIAALAVVALALVQAPLIMTDSTDSYRRPSGLLAALAPGTAVASAGVRSHLTGEVPPWRFPDRDVRSLARFGATVGDFAVGRFHGYHYPLAPDLEGLSSPFSAFVRAGFRQLGGRERTAWLRALGVERVVWPGEGAPPGLRLLASRESFGGIVTLYEVPDPAPLAWAPAEIEAAASPAAAFLAVSHLDDPVRRVVVPEPMEHRAGSVVRVTAAAPDRLALRVTGPGGVVVLRRAWLPAYRGRVDGEPAKLFPVNLVLTGVRVEAGEHEVEMGISPLPEAAAGVIAFAALVALGWWGRRP